MQMKPEQLEIIKEQFKTLKDRSAFYARKFKDIDLSDVQTQEDFEKLPFSEKADLREAYPLGLQAVPDEKIIRIHSSSGTTGTPASIMVRRAWLLLPMRSMTSGVGPMNTMSLSRHSLANVEFSDRKP